MPLLGLLPLVLVLLTLGLLTLGRLTAALLGPLIRLALRALLTLLSPRSSRRLSALPLRSGLVGSRFREGQRDLGCLSLLYAHLGLRELVAFSRGRDKVISRR